MRRWIVPSVVIVLGLLVAAVAGRIALSLVDSGRKPTWIAGGVDVHGDPRPAAAVARLGTLRFRSTDRAGPIWLDDERLVGGGFGGEIVVWNARTGERLQTLIGHSAPLIRPPDRWSFRDYRRVLAGGPAPWHSDRLDEMHLLSDGRLLSTGTSIRTWDLATGIGKLVAVPGGGNVTGVVLLDDERTLLYGFWECLRRIDLVSGRELERLPVPGVVLIGSRLVDDHFLVGQAREGSQRVLVDVRTGESTPLAAIPGSNSRLCAFSRDGTSLWVTTDPGADVEGETTVDLLDRESLDLLRRIELPGRNWIVLGPTLDETHIVAVAMDGRRCVVDAVTGRVVWQGDSSGVVRAPGPLAPDGIRRAWIDVRTGTVQIVDRRTGEDLVPFDAHTRRVCDLAFGADGERLYSASDDGTVRAWIPRTSRVDWTTRLAGVASLVLASDGASLHVAHTNAITELAIETGEQRGERSIEGRVDALLADGSALIWDDERLAVLPPRGVIDAPFCETAASSKRAGEHVLSALSFNATTGIALTRWESRTPQEDSDGWQSTSSLRALRVATGELVWQSAWPTVEVAEASLDGRYVAVGDLFGDVALLAGVGGELTRMERAHRVEGRPDDDRRTTVVAFDATGTRVATGGADGVVRVWSVPTLEELHTFRGHDGWISALAFSPDGKLLASGSHDTAILLWELP